MANNDNKSQSEIERINEVIKRLQSSEIGKDESKAYQLIHANVGQSGFSFGKTQIDLANHQKFRDDFMKWLTGAAQATPDEIASIGKALETKSQLSALSDPQKTIINNALQSDTGRAWVDLQDIKRAKEVINQTNSVIDAAKKNPRYESDPSFQQFIDSPLFSAMVEDNVNQYGAPVTMIKYVKGEKIDKWGIQLGGKPLNLTTLAEYENNYDFIRNGEASDRNKGKKDILRRRISVLDSLLNKNTITKEEYAEHRRTIESTYKSATERASEKNGAPTQLIIPAATPEKPKAQREPIPPPEPRPTTPPQLPPPQLSASRGYGQDFPRDRLGFLSR